jgi:hypothetical protein
VCEVRVNGLGASWMGCERGWHRGVQGCCRCLLAGQAMHVQYTRPGCAPHTHTHLHTQQRLLPLLLPALLILL